MDLPSQLANSTSFKRLADHLSSLVSESSQTIVVLRGADGNYLGLTGGIASPSELRFANPALQSQFKNPAAYSSVLLDSDENHTLRPEERNFLSKLAHSFDPHTGSLPGWEVVAKLTKPLDGSTSLEGAIPVGLPFAINNESSYALILEHLGGLQKIHELQTSSDLVFYSEKDHPYARVTVPTSITQSLNGLEYHQPAQLHVVFDLHSSTTAGYEVAVQGKTLSNAPLPGAEEWKRIEGVLLSKLAELSPSPDTGEKGWITFAAPRKSDTIAINAAIHRQRSEALATHIERFTSLLEPHQSIPMQNLAPHLPGEYAAMSFGQFGFRMMIAAASHCGLVRDSEKRSLTPTLQSVTSLIASRLREPAVGVSFDEMDKLEDLLSTLKMTAFNQPETYTQRYPALAAALPAGTTIALSRSGDVFQDSLEALRNGDLSYIMAARGCAQLQLRVEIDGTEYAADLSVGGKHGQISYTIFTNPEQREFAFNNEESQVYNQVYAMLGREIDSYWELGNQLGFSLDEVWKVWKHPHYEDRQNIPHKLLRAQGFRASIRGGVPHFIESPEEVSPEVRSFNEMLIAGIQKVHEIGHVIVNWNSMSNMNQTGKHADAYGPMSKERFEELYPNGIISNNLLFARQELVGDTRYPPEFYAVPFYLKSLGYQYDASRREWRE
jgi:hypothetical protein